jgi:hypothetical protein
MYVTSEKQPLQCVKIERCVPCVQLKNAILSKVIE